MSIAAANSHAISSHAMNSAGSLAETMGPLVTPDLAPAAPRRPSLPARLRARAQDQVRRRFSDPLQDPSRRPGFIRRLRLAAAVLAISTGVGLYFALREKPQPDYLDAGMDAILDYTFLTEEFNRLPLKDRLELVGQLVSRFKSMDSGDSALMAAFAAGIAGQARDQLMSNISLLAIDIWDSYAVRYDGIPDEDRSKFLEEAFLDFTKSMESVAGVQRSISDQERLDQARRDAKRDTEAMRSGRGPSGDQLGRMFTFMRDGVGSRATPHQRARGAVLMRDMMRQFREDGGKR